MRVLVTGGNGFIGSVVVRRLAAAGHDVRCLLRATSDTSRIQGLRYEPRIGDVRDVASIQAASEGCDAVIHLAGIASWDLIESPLMDEVHVGGTRNVLAGTPASSTVVYVSTAAAIGGTKAPVVLTERDQVHLPRRGYRYAHVKLEAEALCRAAAADGRRVVIVNPAEVYGPHDTDRITCGNLIDFATSKPALVPKGGTSVVHVEDVAAGIVAALTRGTSGERYLLGGENLSVRELAELTLDILGLGHRVVTLPNRLLLTLAALGRTLRIPMPFEPAVMPYATRYWFADNARARQELGVDFRPARAALEDTLQWCQQAGLLPGGTTGNAVEAA